MRKRRDIVDNGSWPYAEELFGRGDPAFVDEIRRITDGEKLGTFALTWFTDERPEARQLLVDYLARPLNSFRHEPLVKRLFKLAEQANDDIIMACFLAAFDRSVRRFTKKRRHQLSERFRDRNAAETQRRSWEQQGMETHLWEWRNRFNVSANWTEETLKVPGGTQIWRPAEKHQKGPYPIDEPFRERLQSQWLFSLKTRRYLRRRAWRYFRKLGKAKPDRYVHAVTQALKLYQDEDVATGLALIDNWGLLHILFHHSPVLQSTWNGWKLAGDRKLGELQPAPMYEDLWKASPQSLYELVKEGQCRPVRQWAVQRIKQDIQAVLARVPAEQFFELLTSDDLEVVSLAADILGEAPDLAALGVERLLGLLNEPRADTVHVICDLLQKKLGADKITLAQAVQLAASRPIPAARLGFTWLQTKKPASAHECQVILGLTSAEAEPLRTDLSRWARGVLSASPHFQPDWVLEFLDSRHHEVRAVGWTWFLEDDRTKADFEIWRKLLESPYDDIRLRLVSELEKHVNAGNGKWLDNDKLDAELLRFLWSSVLLNIHRGNRSKPVVAAQLVRRVQQRPADAELLLPILSVALRSLRGPEWRVGLAGVVQLVERNRDLAPKVQTMFPELAM